MINAKQLALSLDATYSEYEYCFNGPNKHFELEIIDQIEIGTEHYLYLVKYTLCGDLEMMPGILARIDSLTTKEIRENLRVVADSDMEAAIDRFQNISDDLRKVIQNGLFIVHSKVTKNLKMQTFPNPIEERTKNVVAEFYNVVESQYGSVSFLFENNAILPAWKK